MIIKKIVVKNWRSIKNPLTLEFTDGVNVIHGDNGRGKSTVMEALRMGFFDRHGITGEEINKMRPWGCELYPHVQIEFSHGEKNYRLTKQFIGNKSSLVERQDGDGAYVHYMESDGADAWLRSIMSGEAVVRGVSKPSHWGFAGLLWVPQGAADYATPNAALMRRIREKTSAQNESQNARAGSVESAIYSEYLKYFTENGKPRSGAQSIKELETKVFQLRGEQNERLRKLQNMETLRDAVKAAKQKIDKCESDIKEFELRFKEAETNIDKYDKFKREHDALKARRDNLEHERKSIERDLNDIKEAQNDIDRYKKQIAARNKDICEATEKMKLIDKQINEKIAKAHSEKDSPFIKLEFEAETDVAWEPMEHAGASAQDKIRAGETAVLKGLDKVQVRLPSVGTITVTGPSNAHAAALQESIDALRQQHESCAKRVADYKREITNTNEFMERANAKISNVLTQGKTAQSVTNAHHEILGKLQNIKTEMETIRGEVEKLGYNPHSEMEKLKEQLKHKRGEREELTKQISEHTGQLCAFGQMGLYEDASAKEEELNELEALLNESTVKADALKLIWDTMLGVKREFQEQVTTPVERRASELFSIISGKDDGNIKLTDEFTVGSFEPRVGTNMRVEMNCLSGGEREQLYFCTRLALAERLIGEEVREKYPLVLDDFLTATDETRLFRLKEILLSFEHRYQYLIFTCHKNRYADMHGANVKFLEI